MKHLYGLVFVGLTVLPLMAQTSSSVKVVELESAPATSGLDLLKQANKDKQISLQTQSAPQPAAAKTTPKEQPKTSATAPATAPATKAVKKAEEKNTAPQGNTLDIPLEMGGTVTNVQATVTKPLSAAAAKRVEEAKQKRAQAAKTASGTAAKEKVAQTPAPSKEPTALEKDIEVSNALLPEGERNAQAESEEEAAADAELEYAVKMLEKSKEEASAGRTIPPSAAKNKPATVPTANKKFNPNSFRPGVEWQFSKSTHFDIYTQKPTGGQIGSANMAMTFEGAYATLRRFIPWMMSGKVRVFVYQDHNSYLKYEPEAKAWTRALAYPTRGEIVVYDEPGKQQDLKEVFTHELTHIFTQQFFDKHNTGRIMTPTWLDEGLAVLVEDQAYSGSKGGPWNHDYQTLNIQRDPSEQPFSYKSSSSMFSSSRNQRNDRFGKNSKRGRPIYLVPFEQFIQEDSLDIAESKNNTQQWYLQAYLMVRFLLNPGGGSSPSNRMQFEQFTRLMSDGEQVRDPDTGFIVRDAKGNPVYKPYDVEKALARVYHYNNIASFEDAFWRWMK